MHSGCFEPQMKAFTQNWREGATFIILQILRDFTWLQEGVDSAKHSVFFIK